MEEIEYQIWILEEAIALIELDLNHIRKIFVLNLPQHDADIEPGRYNVPLQPTLLVEAACAPKAIFSAVQNSIRRRHE